MSDQPEATTTAARVLPLSDAEVEEFRQNHSRHVCWGWPPRWLATLDAARTRAVAAERKIARLNSTVLLQENARLELGIVAAESALAAERQARERAEQDAEQQEGLHENTAAMLRGTERDLRETLDTLAAERQRAERAEAALATERGRGERLVKDVSAISDHPTPSAGEWVADKLEWALDRWREAASSQAAPHEPQGEQP